MLFLDRFDTAEVTQCSQTRLLAGLTGTDVMLLELREMCPDLLSQPLLPCLAAEPPSRHAGSVSPRSVESQQEELELTRSCTIGTMKLSALFLCASALFAAEEFSTS